MTGAERRATILRAARGEFARVGYHGASTASIARAAGCSEPMLYKHFAGKLALLIAAMEELASDLDARVQHLMAAEGPLLDVVIEHIPEMAADPVYQEMARMRAMAGSLVGEPGVCDAVERYLGQHGQRIRVAFERAQAEGTVRDDVTPGYVAWMWIGMLQAACFRGRFEPDGFQAMVPHMQTFFEGLRAR